MRRLLNFFNRFSSKKPEEESGDIEALRLDFQARYHNFKLLLSANNKSLEIMAHIEKALDGTNPFGMSFIRANCTAVAVNVFRMIQNLDMLAPGKYEELYTRFKSIEQHLNEILTHKHTLKDDRFVIPLKDIDKDMADIVGSKMANIGEIQNRIGLQVPQGFVITAAAYDRFLQHNDLQAEIDRLIQTADMEDMERLYTLSAEIQQMIIRSEIPLDVFYAVSDAVSEIKGEGVTFALRSSALGEDSAESSFAGQYRSILNVNKDHIFDAYREVVASKYGLPAITYRINKGFRDEDISMCVGCLAMVQALAGGVIYSRNPVNSSDDSIFINSAWGLPKSVVDGSVACDLFVISRHPSLQLAHTDIQNKEIQFICDPGEGVCRDEITGESRNLPSLTKDQVLKLADLAVKVESYYGVPQDIEWAIPINDYSAIYLLQCRPLQQKPCAQNEYSGSTNTIEDENIIACGGITASPGAACGKIYIVEKGLDMFQFPKGAVLVTRQALPRWASLLDRACAVVTEQGGFAGHLANVAREFDIPALFGVPDIVKKLTAGETITVDAGARLIYRGKIETILSAPQKKRNLMENSPVFGTLRDVSRHIIPLNLLDPDSPDFKPSNCKTLHDITRFVHEKSVHEMFNFGKTHNFSERTSKQLYYHVPMQWWILNLDDGFKNEVKGKYVKLENIASIPMMAFWDGIVAIPWDGPPPIDGKGLMSVIFEATVNTALTTGTRSKYSERNYFMISKNYCSLSSRLGFHFSIMEALVSDRTIENYISFRYKGGAADSERKIKRVEFIGDVLSEYGFSIDIDDDNLTARVEGYEPEYMKSRLKILGYLTLHTRQLDMIMSKPSTVRYYRQKFRKDIDSVILKQETAKNVSKHE